MGYFRSAQTESKLRSDLPIIGAFTGLLIAMAGFVGLFLNRPPLWLAWVELAVSGFTLGAAFFASKRRHPNAWLFGFAMLITAVNTVNFHLRPVSNHLAIALLLLPTFAVFSSSFAWFSLTGIILFISMGAWNFQLLGAEWLQLVGILSISFALGSAILYGRLAAALRMEKIESQSSAVRLELGVLQSQLQFVAEHGKDVFFRVQASPVFRYQYLSPSIHTVTGYSPEEYYADPSVVHKLVRPETWSDMVTNVGKKKQTSLEFKFLHRDGSEHWVDVQAMPVRNMGRELCFEGIARDITERKKIERELIEAKKEAEKASRIKTDIFAKLNHELRTPLTAIIGYTDLLLQAPAEPQRLKFIEAIEVGAMRLHQLLNGVIDIARIESEGMRIDPRQVSLKDSVTKTVALLAVLAEKKGLGLEAMVSGEPQVYADSEALEIVLTNLLSNAIRYTERGTVQVRMAASPMAGYIRLVVADTGIGIDDSFLPFVFDEFRRENPKSNDGGSGLGLAITKHVVTRLHGAISMESQKGLGTTVFLDLPGSPEAVTQERARPPA